MENEFVESFYEKLKGQLDSEDITKKIGEYVTTLISELTSNDAAKKLAGRMNDSIEAKLNGMDVLAVGSAVSSALSENRYGTAIELVETLNGKPTHYIDIALAFYARATEGQAGAEMFKKLGNHYLKKSKIGLENIE